jgi:hypothetical protein
MIKRKKTMNKLLLLLISLILLSSISSAKLVEISGIINNTLDIGVDGVRLDFGTYHTFTQSQFIVNNTDLAPTYGTGERVTGTTYWSNDTDIEIQVFSHANTVSQNAQIELNINGITTQHIALRPIGVAEEVYTPTTIIIPKHSSYNLTFLNYHHYEWREYKKVNGYYQITIPSGSYNVLLQQTGYNNQTVPKNLVSSQTLNFTMVENLHEDIEQLAILGLIAFILVIYLLKKYKKK